MAFTACSNAATEAGRWPMSRTAVSPTPMPSSVRPGWMLSTVAMEPAITAGCRITGFSISGPSTMASVTCNACANIT